jgi:hypothetical protein
MTPGASPARASVAIESPKSPTSTRPSAATKQFDGLMSRCRIPIDAAASSPVITCRIASTAFAGGIGAPGTTRSFSVPDGASSIAMTGKPCTSVVPNT